MARNNWLGTGAMLFALFLIASALLLAGCAASQPTGEAVVAKLGNDEAGVAPAYTYAPGTVPQPSKVPAALEPNITPADAGQKGQLFFEAGGKPYKGGAGAKVVIFEVSDFQCPFCARVQPTVKQIEKDYGGKVRIYFVHFLLHQYSQKAAEAAECAGEQGKFWEMHDKLFENQNNLGPIYLEAYGESIGLNTTQFNYCLESSKNTVKVLADVAQVRERLGPKMLPSGISTPTFVINNRIIVGAEDYSKFKEAIDAELGAG